MVAEWLERAGLEVHVEEAASGRPNVVAVARGRGGGRSLLLNAHTDTVGLLEPDGGVAPRVEDGRLYG
ncbi:MAG: acetylornithine deacetylase, partial [Gaiellaceae bacterium]